MIFYAITIVYIFCVFFPRMADISFGRNTLEINMKDLVEIRWHGRGGQGAGLPHRRT